MNDSNNIFPNDDSVWTNTGKHPPQRGGGIIGSGISGTVYMPPVDCVPYFAHSSVNYVSKVYKHKDAFDEEMKYMELLRVLDPAQNFTIQSEHTCTTAEGNPVMIMKYGGKSVESIVFEHSENISTKTILLAIIELAPYIYNMNKEHIYHNDIRLGNLLYNNTTNRSHLIDWGFSTTLEDAMKKTMGKLGFNTIITPMFSFKRAELLMRLKEMSHFYIYESLRSNDLYSLLQSLYEIVSNPSTVWVGPDIREPLTIYLNRVISRDDIVFEGYPAIFTELKSLLGDTSIPPRTVGMGGLRSH